MGPKRRPRDAPNATVTPELLVDILRANPEHGLRLHAAIDEREHPEVVGDASVIRAHAVAEYVVQHGGGAATATTAAAAAAAAIDAASRPLEISEAAVAAETKRRYNWRLRPVRHDDSDSDSDDGLWPIPKLEMAVAEVTTLIRTPEIALWHGQLENYRSMNCPGLADLLRDLDASELFEPVLAKLRVAVRRRQTNDEGRAAVSRLFLDPHEGPIVREILLRLSEVLFNNKERFSAPPLELRGSDFRRLARLDIGYLRTLPSVEALKQDLSFV